MLPERRTKALLLSLVVLISLTSVDQYLIYKDIHYRSDIKLPSIPIHDFECEFFLINNAGTDFVTRSPIKKGNVLNSILSIILHEKSKFSVTIKVKSHDQDSLCDFNFKQGFLTNL